MLHIHSLSWSRVVVASTCQVTSWSVGRLVGMLSDWRTNSSIRQIANEQERMTWLPLSNLNHIETCKTYLWLNFETHSIKNPQLLRFVAVRSISQHTKL